MNACERCFARSRVLEKAARGESGCAVPVLGVGAGERGSGRTGYSPLYPRPVRVGCCYFLSSLVDADIDQGDGAAHAHLTALTCAKFLQGGFLHEQADDALGLRTQLETERSCGSAVVIEGFPAYPQRAVCAFAADNGSGLVDLGKSRVPLAIARRSFAPRFS